MATSQKIALKKLQSAINCHSENKILVSTSEFYSEDRHKAITAYVIRLALPNSGRTRKKTIELFSTTSLIQAVLYLRDYWYSLSDIPIPTDNEYWNEIKRKKGIVIDAKAEIFN